MAENGSYHFRHLTLRQDSKARSSPQLVLLDTGREAQIELAQGPLRHEAISPVIYGAPVWINIKAESRGDTHWPSMLEDHSGQD